MASQDLSAKKRNFMLRYQGAVQRLMDARRDLVGISSEWTDIGASIAQGDIDGSQFLHLTPAILANGITSLVQLENYLGNAAVTQGAHRTNFNALIGT